MRELSSNEIQAVSGGIFGVLVTAFVKGWNIGTDWVSGGAQSFGTWVYNDGNYRVSMK